VATVAPSATVAQNVVTYPVQIEFDSGTTPVKVGMSATADIQVQKIENAILAPSRAVQTSGTTKESAMTTDQSVFKHVKYAWDDAVAAALDPVGRLVYRSNILGADGRITNTGGGNTSSKIVLPDPLTGNETEVLWVKGSGGDLRTARRDNFASLYLDKLRGLQQHDHHAPSAAPSPRSRTRSSGSTRTPPSTSTRARRRSTPRCTPSCRFGTSTICTPTP